MSLLSPALLLVAVFLCAASSSPSLPNAHDTEFHNYASASLQSLGNIQKRHMTSSFLPKATASSTIPFAASTVSGLQLLKLGRNLLNLEKEKQQSPQSQQQQQQQQQSSTKDSKDNDDKDSFVVVRSSPSVVQNWNLVCKQLCGASLGGGPCAAECAGNISQLPSNPAKFHGVEHHTVAGDKSAHTRFEKSRAAICVDLCEVGLGGTSCKCKYIKSSMDTQENVPNFDIVCTSFCLHANTTIKGCSPCQLLETTLDDDHEEIAKSNSILTPDRLMYPQAIAPAEATTATTTTTPNWDELCASLCKTGDGGSLCNCDLSPFFI